METIKGTEKAVCDDIAARQRLGIAKYGTTVSENKLSLNEWLQHAYEECLDQAVYLKRAMEELQSGLPCTVCEDVRKRLGGHKQSMLDGDNGLAAATMRSHDSMQRVYDRLETRVRHDRNAERDE